MKTIFSKTLKSIYLCCFLFLSAFAFCFAQNRDFYEIKVYRLADKQQEQEVDTFLKQAYLPALHRAGIAKVGVFKPVEKDTANYGKRIYVLIPFYSLDEFDKLDSKLQKDNQYQASAYWTAYYSSPPYARIESILLKSFVNMPQFQIPQLSGPVNQRIYELRSYESPTEKLYVNKVQMFNDGDEIGLFKRLGFNAVFYAEVLAGSKMPNLMYMTSFNDIASHDEHWKTFVDDPQWKKLSAMPEYQHNVSKADIYLLHPTDYSEL